MVVALLTDIHGNREALEACLADAERRSVQRYIFLGDYVGYGADPAWVLDIVRAHVERGAVALLGNHDAAIARPQRMNPMARAAIDWTRGQLDADRRAFLARLSLMHQEGERLYVHANAVAPEGWDYITNRLEAARSLMASRKRVLICGHVHVPQLYRMAPNGLLAEFTPEPDRAVPLDAESRWVAVLGAVGQPRDGDPRACYALFDDERNELTFIRVPYDMERAARKILDSGLPPTLAARLLRGV
jgi:diadenosine tetraphosphatase ApaH/serine/threonine PP2A family protein phosphatase